MRIWTWLWPRLSDVERAVAQSSLSGGNEDNNVIFSRQSSVFGSMEDSDVAAEKERIVSTPLDQLYQTDSIIMKV